MAPLRCVARRAPTVLAALLWSVTAVGSTAAAPVGPSASLALTPMTYVASRGAANELVLEADHAAYRPGSSLVKLRGVRVSVAASAEQVGFEMTCERGELDLDASDFRALGSVRGRTRDGREIATEELHYEHAEGLVAADTPVEIRDSGGVYSGGGFRYHVRDGRFQLVGGAKLVQQP